MTAKVIPSVKIWKIQIFICKFFGKKCCMLTKAAFKNIKQTIVKTEIS